MRAAYIHSELFPSDSAGTVFVLNTCIGMAQAGIRTHLIVPQSSKAKTQEFLRNHPASSVPGLRITDIKGLDRRKGLFRFSWRGLFYRNAYEYLVELNSATPIDVVISRDLRFLDFYLSRSRRLPAVYEAHNFYADVEGKWPDPELVEGHKLRQEQKLAEVERGVVGNVHSLIFLSRAMKKAFEDHYRKMAPSVVAHSGLHAQPLDRLPSPESRTVCYVGKLHPHKGLRLLLQAVAKMPGDVSLLVVGGDAYLEENREMARSLGIDRRCRFSGFVPNHRIPELLADCSVGAVPLMDCFYNRYLTSPMKVFDYIAAGLPLVAPDFPLFEEILTHEENALFFAPNSADDLARCLSVLLEDRGLYKKLQENQLKLCSKYTWQKRGEIIRGLVEAVRNEPKKPSNAPAR